MSATLSSTLRSFGLFLILAAVMASTSLTWADQDAKAPAGNVIRPFPLALPAPQHATAGQAFLAKCGALLAGANTAPALDPKKKNEEVAEMKAELKRNVVGQDDAIDVFGDFFVKLLSFLNDPKKPIGSALFIGPTGVGKTELVKAIVRFFGGNPDTQLIRVDGGELQFSHNISRLIGTTAGYEGCKDTPLLHQDNVCKTMLTFRLKSGEILELQLTLFDEFEKMHTDISNMMLAILDEGRATMGDNAPSSFRKSLIIGTSNLGAKEVKELVEERKLEIREREARGDILTPIEKDWTGRLDLKLRQKMHDTIIAAMDARYRPEFKGRWDAIVQFLYHGHEQFIEITDIFLSKLQKRVFERAKAKFAFEVLPEVKEWLVSRGTDFMLGARSLNNVIEFQLTNKFATLLANGDIKEGDVLSVSVKNDELVFLPVARGQSRDLLKAFADQTYPNQKMLSAKFESQDQKDLEDKRAIIAGLMKELDDSPVGNLVGQTVWLESARSKEKHTQINSAESVGTEVTYKYILIDDIPVRVHFNGRELANTSTGGKAKYAHINFEVVERIPQEEEKDYSGETIDRWERLRIMGKLELAKSGAKPTFGPPSDGTPTPKPAPAPRGIRPL